MKEGDVVLTSLPQADGNTKLRPALLLRFFPPFNDCLVCGISSQTRHYVEGLDDRINENDREFETSGLKESAIIRLGFLAVLPSEQIAGKIGSVSEKLHYSLLKKLASHLLKKE